jgi:cell division protein FtsW (lipid II flippase)
MYNFSRKKFFQGFQKIQKKYDMWLLAIVGVLVVAGLTFLASTLSVLVQAEFYKHFLYQLLFGVWIGGVLCYILARLDYHELFKHQKMFIIVTMTLLIIVGGFAGFLKVSGKNASDQKKFIDGLANSYAAPAYSKGAVRWFEVGSLRIQPSELAKLTLLIVFAAVLNKLKGQEITWMSLKKPLYLFAVTAFLVYIQPDLGNVIILFGILFTAMWMVKVPPKILSTLIVCIILVGIFGIFTEGYRKGRFDVVFNNSQASEAQSYQIKQSKAALTNGGIWGLGYGNSEAKQAEKVPESTNDAIIAIIGEEIGFVGTIIFLSFYVALGFRGLKIAREAPDDGGTALAAGITFWIVSQALLNVGGITGILPLKGLPLPFVSEGGTAMVLNLASIGILLNISSQAIKSEKQSIRKTFTPVRGKK